MLSQSYHRLPDFSSHRDHRIAYEPLTCFSGAMKPRLDTSSPFRERGRPEQDPKMSHEGLVPPLLPLP